MSAKRTKCPRCGCRRTMQKALKWRIREEDEFQPVCGECWQELFTADAIYRAVLYASPEQIAAERSRKKAAA